MLNAEVKKLYGDIAFGFNLSAFGLYLLTA